MQTIPRLNKALALSLICGVAPAAAAAPSVSTEMPPEVLSWREVIVPSEQYLQAVEAWRTYADAHPGAAVAYVQMARAARYAATASAEERAQWVKQAVEIDPECPEALLAYAENLDREIIGQLNYRRATEAYELARKAAGLAPDWPDPHYLLWSMALLEGDHADARTHAATLMKKGAFVAPVVDFGYNLLVSARPNAIIFTNGDNDTYPPVALQALHGIRRDLTIVNLSLLNTPSYEQRIWSAGGQAPPPFSPEETKSMRESWRSQYKAKKKEPYAHAFVRALGEKIAAGKYDNPAYFAVTVEPTVLDGCGRVLELEGVLLRMLAEPAQGNPELDRRVAGERTLDLFRHELRLDSATSLTHRWREGSAARHLMRNYPAVLSMTATECAARGDVEEVRYCLDTAVHILEFHDQDELAAQMRQYRNEIIHQP